MRDNYRHRDRSYSPKPRRNSDNSRYMKMPPSYGQPSATPVYKGSRLHIRNLEIGASKEELESIFSRYGAIYEVYIARQTPCFGFVNFKHKSDAEKALKKTDGMIVGRSKISVSVARDRQKINGQVISNRSQSPSQFSPKRNRSPIRHRSPVRYRSPRRNARRPDLSPNRNFGSRYENMQKSDDMWHNSESFQKPYHSRHQHDSFNEGSAQRYRSKHQANEDEKFNNRRDSYYSEKRDNYRRKNNFQDFTDRKWTRDGSRFISNQDNNDNFSRSRNSDKYDNGHNFSREKSPIEGRYAKDNYNQRNDSRSNYNRKRYNVSDRNYNKNRDNHAISGYRSESE